MFDSSLQFSAKLFLVFFNKSLQQQQQQAYPQRLYLFVYFLNRTVSCCIFFTFATYILQAPVMSSVFCMNCFAVSFLKLLLKSLCNLEKLHGIAHNFLLLCRTLNRCCDLSAFDAAIIPVIWQQPNPRKALARPINDPEPPFRTEQPIKRLEPPFQGN